MGHGDDIIATGMARGAKQRGKRIAFGDGRLIIWGPFSRSMFANNPNIAKPGEERASDIEWCSFYKGHRIYNRAEANRWVWNYDFHVKPGEFFFGPEERQYPRDGFIFIEPHVKRGVGTSNKDWGFHNYQEVVNRLPAYEFVQCDYGLPILESVTVVKTKTFREMLQILRSASLAIVPEGGLHHSAAALEVQAIVIFGGWIPPQIMGYDWHINITGGATDFCGSFKPCDHCAKALANISVDEVLSHV